MSLSTNFGGDLKQTLTAESLQTHLHQDGADILPHPPLLCPVTLAPSRPTSTQGLKTVKTHRAPNHWRAMLLGLSQPLWPLEPLWSSPTPSPSPRSIFQLSSCLNLGGKQHSPTYSVSALTVHLPILNYIWACLPCSLCSCLRSKLDKGERKEPVHSLESSKMPRRNPPQLSVC